MNKLTPNEKHLLAIDPDDRLDLMSNKKQTAQLDTALKLIGLTSAATAGFLGPYYIKRMLGNAKNTPKETNKKREKKSNAFNTYLVNPVANVADDAYSSIFPRDSHSSSLGYITNPLFTGTLAAGIPTSIIAGKIIKNYIDKKFKPSPENQTELEELKQEFEDLIHKKSNENFTKLSKLVDKLEEKHTKQSIAGNIFTSATLPVFAPFFFGSIPISAYFMGKYLKNTKSTEAQRKQQLEAIRRYRMSKTPDVLARIARDPEEYKKLDKMDSSSRNVVPVKSKSTDKEEDEFDKLGQDIGSLKTIPREYLYPMLNQAGVPSIVTNTIGRTGWGENQLRKAFLHRLDPENNPNSFLGGLAASGKTGFRQPLFNRELFSVMGNPVTPLQLGLAGASLGAGYLADRPAMGAIGAGGAIAAPWLVPTLFGYNPNQKTKQNYNNEY